MRAVLVNLIAALLLASGCAPAAAPRGTSPAVAVTDPVLTQELMLHRPCVPEEASSPAASGAEGDLRSAACYLYLAESAEERDEKLRLVRRGLERAGEVAREHPESPLAHYLLAYLSGLEAEADPLRGLGRVRDIERFALRARDLDPRIDRGGPDRMLGELYLRAPGPPVSVGDPERALFHFRRAADLAADHGENRLGLAEALFAAGETSSSCRELHTYLAGLPLSGEGTEEWRRAMALLNDLCSAAY